MSIEIGQVLHNNPVGVELPDFADALCVAIRSEIARVYWNVNQKGWGGAGYGDIGYIEMWSPESDEAEDDPKIPGVEWREYYNWGGSPDDLDWDQAQADAPNFAFEGVEIRWYKRFGRSMNANVDWSPGKWVKWFDRCLATVRAFESEKTTHWSGLKHEYPDRSCLDCF